METLHDSGDPGLTGEREWDWNDNPTTLMPEFCTACMWRGFSDSAESNRLENRGGFMVCPRCGASWGLPRAITATA